MPPLHLLPLLALGALTLAGAVLAGLARAGWPMPDLAAAAGGLHGPLMLGGFFGTVIGLERAVAIGRRWALAGPLAAGLGAAALLAGLPPVVGQILGICGAIVLIAASVAAWRRQPAFHGVVLALGAACWLVGHLTWMFAGMPAAMPWWLLFPVLTIAGERLELTRFLPTPPGARRLFGAIVALLLLGAAGHFDRLYGGGLLGLALWLLRHDIARRNIRLDGLPRYIAACLLSGYAWLALGGALGLAGALAPGHPWHDAALHAVTLGFIFAMVFGHAPIVLPAVAGIRLPWHPALYLPLLMLHATLCARFLGGLADSVPLWRYAALSNGLALAVFIATAILLVRRRSSRGSP